MRSKLAEMAVLLIFATSSQAESVDYLGAGAPKLRELTTAAQLLAQSMNNEARSISGEIGPGAEFAKPPRHDGQFRLAEIDTKPAPQLALADQKKSAARQSTPVSAAQIRIMTPLLGNTLVYANDSDTEIRHEVYNADHTWVTWYPNTAPKWGNSYSAPRFRGTWEFRDEGTLCAVYHRSNLHPHQTRCDRMTVHHVGDTWTNSDHLTVTLLSGIQ